MVAKRWLWTSCLFMILVLSACNMNTVTETAGLVETPTSGPQSAPAEPVVITEEGQPQTAPTSRGEPVIIAEGPPCLSRTLGITLTMPSPAWNCEPLNESWLKLTSSLFEVNISNLGRGPFCFPDMDSSCETTPFFSNQIIDLQLYSSGGQAREIFGLAEFPDSEISVWVAITWQDMAAHSLSEAEVTEIEKLVSTLSLLDL